MDIKGAVDRYNELKAARRANFVVPPEEKKQHRELMGHVSDTFDTLVMDRRQVFPYGFPPVRPLDTQFYEAFYMGDHKIDGSLESVYIQPSIHKKYSGGTIYQLYAVVPNRDQDPQTITEHYHGGNSRMIGRLEVETDNPITRIEQANLQEFSELLNEVVATNTAQ